MSWSIEIDHGTPAGDAVGLVQKQFQAAYPVPSAEVQEQFDAAVTALRALVPVVQPEATKPVHGYVSGHANAGHVPAEGWANDTVTVTLAQD